MSQSVAHISQHELNGTTLQVVADAADDLSVIIESEQSVIRRYIERGDWPHKRVNLFIVQDLQPLVAQIQRVALLPAVVAEDIDRRPMVNVYDAANLAECAIFVNRSAIEHDGLWHDALALRGLLAHEHGHPLAENKTVGAVRRLSLELAIDGGRLRFSTITTRAVQPNHDTMFAGAAFSGPGVGQVLLVLLDKLTTRAPQEIFANEIAIRVGFADALFRLDERVFKTASLGVSKRGELVGILDREIAEGRLVSSRKDMLLLIADLGAVLPFALEIAPFVRAGERKHGEKLEARLHDGVFSVLPPEVAVLYRGLRDHYLALATDLDPGTARQWCEDAMAPLLGQIRTLGLDVKAVLRLDKAAAEHPGHEASQAAANPLDGE